MTQYVDLDLGSAVTPLRVSRHAQAKRASLRIDAKAGEPVLVLPRRMALARGLAFAQEHTGWIAEKLNELPAPIPFKDGAVLPYQDQPHLLRHVPYMRSTGAVQGQVIKIGGPDEKLAANTTKFLRGEARRLITEDVETYADMLNREPSGIHMKDTRTRWGSCTPKRLLSFSWRLVFTPPEVRRYIVAHECAHMVHLNHSAAFWQQVEDIYGPYTQARRWLDDNGPALHRIGAGS